MRLRGKVGREDRKTRGMRLEGGGGGEMAMVGLECTTISSKSPFPFVIVVFFLFVCFFGGPVTPTRKDVAKWDPSKILV